MSTTPRKSSIASRRAPPSFRAPSASRKASNPHLSLVFAHGGSIPHHGEGESSKSEAALSRQLDGDLGGQRMGLRSRRSSSATVHTMRTTSAVSLAEEGLRSPILREEDEEEGGMARAGPSKTPMRIPYGRQESREGQLEITPGSRSGGAFVDPKTSSAWRRWNPPPPTFPKTSIGKGKGREVLANGGESMRSFATEKLSTRAAVLGAESPEVTSADNKSAQLNGSPTATLAPPPTEEPPGLSTPKRSWWSRSPIPFSPKPATPSPAPPASAPPAPDPSVIPSIPHSEQSPEPSAVVSDGPNPPLVLAAEIPPAPPESGDKPHPPSDATAANGWFSYLTWGRSMSGTVPLSDPASTVVKNDPTNPVPASEIPPEASSEPPVPPPVASAIPPAESLPPPVVEPPVVSQDSPAGNRETGAAASTSTNAPAGWGPYLYSFVSSTPSTSKPSTAPPDPPITAAVIAPPPAPPQLEEAPPAIEPPQPDLESTIKLSTAPPSVTNTPMLGESPSLPTVPPGSLRKASVTSTRGWLNYLAFRAGQRKITGSTIASNGSASGRPSGEQGREEVMDFSQDPEFPSESPQPPQVGTMLPPPFPTSKDGKPAKKLANKTSGMDIRGKRLSISSTQSAKTPLSSSPVQPTKMETTTKAPSINGRPPSTKSAKGQSGSSLPAPPQPNAQPNLVIPSFSTTFDRPPRSLPPLPPPGATGTAASTGGLAWKALAAAGTYVYRSDPKTATPPPAATPTEARGMKEGRSVGADLPRRVGLEGGAADEGWKGVTRVVVVGVHGWFPAKMLNSVIGEPTGTSTKFAAMMGAAVTKFFEDKGPLPPDFRLTLMPLEGEGTIDNRVDKLYKAYLSNPAWINELRRADAIFFAAHSQGCIVTAHLLWRMITQGHIRTPLNREAVARCEWAFGPIGLLPPEEPRRGRRVRPQDDFGKHQKVAMLAMCGVHLGPLYSISTSTVIQPYLQWFENAAARELFEFQESTSTVSVAYQKALSMILENDVRVVLLASLNDQVVPIYGSSFSTATHPLLLRALFVDGASYSASDFMTNLLCFAFMLRNAGIDDQRLVEHLSEATAGSLTGLGHSSPYEEAASYDLVVNYLFRAGPARKPHSPLVVEHFSARDTRNDFELPWIMRALVDSPEVKDLFPEELKELKEGILAWKPNTKALKEIKRRLEPMAGRQSKLRPLTSSPSSTSLNSMGKTPVKDAKGGSGLGKDW